MIIFSRSFSRHIKLKKQHNILFTVLETLYGGGVLNSNKIDNNFGVRGWGSVLFALVCMFINGMIHTNGANIFFNMINNMHDWSVSTLLSMNTISGIIGVAFSFVIGRLIVRFGAKKIGSIYLILGGFVIMWSGRINSLATFLSALRCYGCLRMDMVRWFLSSW